MIALNNLLRKTKNNEYLSIAGFHTHTHNTQQEHYIASLREWEERKKTNEPFM